MKSKLLIIIALFALAACSPGSSPPPTAGPTRTPTLPPPDLNTTSAPDATQAAQAYLDAWKAEDYAAMYELLSPLSQEAISAEDFEAYYRGIAAEAALESVDYEVLSSLTEPKRSQVNYRVNLNSVLVGEIARDTAANLEKADG